MEIGICTSFERLKLLPEGLADYVELSLMEIEKSSIEVLREVRADICSRGIVAKRSNGFCPPEIKLCGVGYDPLALREYSKRAITMAKEYFGLDHFVVGSGKSRVADPADRIGSMRQLEEAYCIMGDVAGELGALLTIEHLNSGECNMLTTAKESAEFVRRISHPNVKLMVDYFHFSYEKEDISVITDNGDIIKHIHIADPITRYIPSPERGEDYSTLKGALEKIGYNDTMSVESIYGSDFAADAVVAINFLKGIF